LYVIIGGDKKVKVGRTIYYYLVIGGQENTRAFAGGRCHFVIFGFVHSVVTI
jgi:hypothetical protein